MAQAANCHLARGRGKGERESAFVDTCVPACSGKQHLNDQLGRAGVALLDEQVGARDEVVKHVLLVVERACLAPGDAILPAAPAAAQGMLQHPIADLKKCRPCEIQRNGESSQT